MKTTINLADYQFSGKNNPLFQISDSPINMLVRVIEINRGEFLYDINMIALKATTYLIDAVKKIVVFTEETKVDKQMWNIIKGDYTIKIDANYAPVVNPNYDSTLATSPENYPHELTDAFEQFKAISVALNEPLLTMFITSNDDKKLFD